MKKFLALALVLVLAVSLVACGKKGLDVKKVTGEWAIGFVNGQDYDEYCEENGVDGEGSQVYFDIGEEKVRFTTGAGLELEYEVKMCENGLNFMLGEKPVVGCVYDEANDTLTWQGSDGMGGSVDYTSIHIK